MDEFSALPARVAASVGDLRGVLILSRDGLVLGAFPDGDQALLKAAWHRFAGLGDPEKGFVEFAGELWAYVRRGPYASFAVTGSHVRPRLVMDQLEQMLLGAEEVLAGREALRLPDAVPAASGKPRTSPHPEPKQAQTPPARPGVPVGDPYTAPQAPGAQRPPVTPTPAADPNVSGPPSVPSPAPGQDGGPGRPAPPEAPSAPAPAESAPSQPEPPPAEDEGEVDPVLLAREFSLLLQETGEADET